ncbi:MAG: 16S rRNA (guanine(966)-N(2))-methyltransferase RsmD [Candidatus Kapabacteria bacterium]|nr:16S rRNA (guanine(966)-N(2))-methyltransferase RsmD [Candidatus Kapabacteria bacterium]
MRIIGGIFKGRNYKMIISEKVRPTSDYSREVIFNVLENLIDFENIIFADVCAGSGLVGFEALSRGAGHCYFFESDKKNCTAIELFAECLNISDNINLIAGDASKTISKFRQNDPESAFDIVFIDPPYASIVYFKIIEQLHSEHFLKEGSIVVVEHDSTKTIIYPFLKKIKEKKAGQTLIDFFLYIK